MKIAILKFFQFVLLQTKLCRIIARSNGFGTALRILVFNCLRLERKEKINILGKRLVVRTGTPDLFVVLETLTHEYLALERLNFDDQELFLVDAGGYIGTSAIALKDLYPNSTIVILEPSTENHELLTENVRDLQDVHVFKSALVANGAPSQAVLTDNKKGYWGFELSTSETAIGEQVDTITLDEIKERFDRNSIDVLKMDIEGAELELLQNYENWLFSVRVLLIELHERKQSGIERAFSNACRNRLNMRMPGEKFVSFSPKYLARFS